MQVYRSLDWLIDTCMMGSAGVVEMKVDQRIHSQPCVKCNDVALCRWHFRML